jgi:antitoxin HicB
MGRDVLRSSSPETLDDYLALPYRLEIIPGEYGSFVVRYPDLPSCITQVEHLDKALTAAREILEGWLEIALEDGQTIPVPRSREEYSGKFMVRISKSLHRELVVSANAEGVSLNAYVTSLLAAGEVWHGADHRFEQICETISAVMEQLPPHFEGVPKPEYVRHNSPGIQLAFAA